MNQNQREALKCGNWREKVGRRGIKCLI